MDGDLYREKALSRLIEFIDKNYDSRDQVLFSIDNPPNAPQIRPIENYWGILKMKVLKLIV